jgi:hypothetical protein
MSANEIGQRATKMNRRMADDDAARFDLDATQQPADRFQWAAML